MELGHNVNLVGVANFTLRAIKDDMSYDLRAHAFPDIPFAAIFIHVFRSGSEFSKAVTLAPQVNLGIDLDVYRQMPINYNDKVIGMLDALTGIFTLFKGNPDLEIITACYIDVCYDMH